MYLSEAKTAYKIELSGLKNIPVYTDVIYTPSGVKEPEEGDLTRLLLEVNASNPPESFLGSPINDNVLRFIGMYHKLDPIKKKKNLIITTRKNSETSIDALVEVLDEIIPGKFDVKKHKGKKSVFITKKSIVNEIVETLGDRNGKIYPPWLLSTKYEPFLIERFRDVSTPRKNSIEITSSSVNNEVLLQALVKKGFYVNIRRIEHKLSIKRDLWYVSIYPTNEENMQLFKQMTDYNVSLRSKFVIDGENYYLVKRVTRVL